MTLDSLQMLYDRLLSAVDTSFHRSLYPQFNVNSRLTGLVGPRGVGKTTLLLQYIKEQIPDPSRAFYFSADHIYFKERSIYDFVENLFLTQSINIVFIDEIHKYGEDWARELKSLYDGFPKMKIVFSGSSSLDLIKGSYDLTRRAKLFYLPGMSFREYLNFTQGTEFEAWKFIDLMKYYKEYAGEIINHPGILGVYHEYLKAGFYPFTKEDPLSYYEKLLSVVEKTIHEDIANYYNLRTNNLRNFSKILNYLASIPPGNISTYNVGKNLGIDDKTAGSYIAMLNATGLVEIIYASESGNQGLRRPEKVFFNNTNLHHAIGKHMSSNPVDIGAIRELAFVQATKNVGLEVFYNKAGDYRIADFIFEIGGKNKTREQIKETKNAFLVKDDTLAALQGSIPLLFFGFLY